MGNNNRYIKPGFEGYSEDELKEMTEEIPSKHGEEGNSMLNISKELGGIVTQSMSEEDYKKYYQGGGNNEQGKDKKQ